MPDFIHFLIKYWYLSGPFLITIILLIMEEARTKGMFSQISAQEAVIRMNQKQGLILDIRDKKLFKEGHIIGAMNIPKTELAKHYAKLEPYKEKSVIVVCQNGSQSGDVAMELQKKGFTDAVILSGGMQAWQQAHMPVTKK